MPQTEDNLKNTVLIAHVHSTFSYLDRHVSCLNKSPNQPTMKEPPPRTD